MKTYYVPRHYVLFLSVLCGFLLLVLLVGLQQNEGEKRFNLQTEMSREVPGAVRNLKVHLHDDSGTPSNCTEKCRKHINKVTEDYSLNWTKNEDNHQKLRSLLIKNCNGFQKAIMTQINSPLGTTITYDGEKRNRSVTEELFHDFPKDVPFSDKILDTCAVVGNGAILANSSCGEAIDSAQFVIRCNLPPLENDFGKHVGRKTSVVTANPTIFNNKYGGLRGRRRAFVDNVSIYGDALLFLPAFSFTFCTGVSVVAHNTLEDFRSSVRAVFMNPDYLRSLAKFWRAKGLKAFRISSGFMMVSLALEICNNVDVYGFWPFENHPYGYRLIPHHYYDDVKPHGRFHAMPVEFAHLIKLHNEGILKLHVGECLPNS